MSARFRLRDFQLRGAASESVGVCASDTARCSVLVNRAQERLLTCREAGDKGWWGCYAEMVFNVDRNDPYLTLPRGVARIISLAGCQQPVPISNQFFEYLRFGDGTLPKVNCDGVVCEEALTRLLRRNSISTTLGTLTTPGYGLRFYSTSEDDAGKRVLVSGADANGQTLFSRDGVNDTRGYFVTLTDTFADLTAPGSSTAIEISSITGIQKDTTEGIISVYEVNLTTADQTLLLQMEPSEQVAAYQRYYLSSLPANCCEVSTDIVQVTAMVKLDLVPVAVGTDYLLIQSLEALFAEVQSMRFAEMDDTGSLAKSEERHRAAVRYLNGQLAHYEGTHAPSVQFAPFGVSSLLKQRIGSMR